MNPADLFSREPNPLRLAADEVLFEAGQPGDCMYVVLQGALEIIIDQQVIERSTRGDIIGEMALIDESPRSATVIAREPSALAQLNARRFQTVIQQNPYFATHVMKVLVSRIRRIDRVREQQNKPGIHH